MESTFINHVSRVELREFEVNHIPADSTFFAMVRVIVLSSKVFTQTTEIISEFRVTLAAKFTKLNKNNNFYVGLMLQHILCFIYV